MLGSLFRQAIDAVAGDAAMADALHRQPLPAGPVAVLAIGKAADSMCRGALQVLEGRLSCGLLITKQEHLSAACREHPRLRCLESAHPIPDQRTLDAGLALRQFLGELPSGVPLLVLLSGGASSLVEELPAGFGARALAEMNRWLLSRDLPIDSINAVRRAVSCIKGGRLRRRLGERPLHVYLISDVPGDDPAVIGSGLLFPPPASVALPTSLPASVQHMLEAAPPLPEPPTGNDATMRWEVIASNRLACEAVVRAAKERGLTVHWNAELQQGSAIEAGSGIAKALQAAAPGLYVQGGETTVALPENPGRGGRAQALALRAAIDLSGLDDCVLLAAGTDGTDGPGEDAGAIIDGRTCTRGRQHGLDPAACLEAADSGRFLQASGDLIRTGPTGTNVMDLYISYKFNV
nr:DUF4147 domain-containing protein [Methylonatrum kenyense]